MKIIFLDIDGVLNHHGAVTNHFRLPHFLPEHQAHLEKVLKNTDANVVISSTWRIGKSIEQLKQLFFSSGLDGDRIIDKTRSNMRDDDGQLIVIANTRAGEIQEWLDRHLEIKNFVVFDDETLGAFGNRHIKTDFMFGLQEHHADKAIKLLMEEM